MFEAYRSSRIRAVVPRRLFVNSVSLWDAGRGRSRTTLPIDFYVTMLDSKGKDGPARDLENFYKMIDGSTVSWVNQSEPRGLATWC